MDLEKVGKEKIGKKLEKYERVKSRKKRFRTDHPDGRIIVKCVKADKQMALFCCKIYKSIQEQISDMPISVGYAMEFKGEGGPANKFSWVENCEESAIGRALDNAGYSGNDLCSREEMLKVERHKMLKVEKHRKSGIGF